MAQKIDERFGVLDVLVNNARSIVESAPGSCEIAPWVSTEWSAEEVAAVVAFLASPMANYLVGEVVAVNGSLLMI